MPVQPCILFAEDYASLRRLIKTILIAEGHAVLDANNGRAALELFRQHRDAIKLLITDVSMPDMTGGELITEVRRLTPLMPVLVISALRPDWEGALRPGGVDTRFLEKPFPLPTFTKTVKEMWTKSPMIVPQAPTVPGSSLSPHRRHRRRKRRVLLV